MTKLEKEAEEKYCKGCKWRIEQCLWAWRKTNGLKEPNEKNCSCKEVPAYLAGAEPREKRIAELIALIDAERKRQEECDDVHLRKITDLEKENAELKERLKEHESVGNSQFWKNVWSWKSKAEQLTKAKEIIKILMVYVPVDLKEYEEAKQFLNSEVKK